jgi:uncharacterized membrane-anchored protein YitT (DUF2179 family)
MNFNKAIFVLLFIIVIFVFLVFGLNVFLIVLNIMNKGG